jgi:hypothetical protein
MSCVYVDFDIYVNKGFKKMVVLCLTTMKDYDFLFFFKGITPPIIIDNYDFLNNKAKP